MSPRAHHSRGPASLVLCLPFTPDLYFYDGPSQAEITRSYQKSAVGFPAMQQLWTFGFHQCRWGYHNWSEVEDVVRNFENFGIPLETIWSEFRRCPLFPG